MSQTVITSRPKLLEILDKMKGCKYRLNSKPALTADPSKIKTADCSGFVRYLLFHITDKKIALPMGSWYQHQWCRENLMSCSYSDAARMDSMLRIAFIEPQGKKYGHVWLVVNAQTVECYSGHGVGRRKWDTKVLTDRKPSCYLIGKLV